MNSIQALGLTGIIIAVIILIAGIIMPLVVICIDSRLARAVKELGRINANLVQLIRLQSKK
jgi:hypothetical protein